MISLALCAPALAGLAALISGKKAARALLTGAAVFNLALCGLLWRFPPASGSWFMADSASLIFLAVTGLLFAACSFYARGYLDTLSPKPHIFSGVFGDEPEPVFISFLLLFLAAMNFVCLSRHIAMMWVALEATTLVSAPLICFHRTPRSLEAAWKYLMICSVGIALALLGNFFIASAAGAANVPMLCDVLRDSARLLNPLWLKLAFVLAFTGYGAKMGLAPMHTWLPDAHGESPSPVSALLSGALLNCAFLSLMRVAAVCSGAGLGEFVNDVFLFFGIASVVIAAAFMLRQRDYKRLLAYSSVENMGIIAAGVGAGTVYGAVLQAINHSLVKAMLFMASGNILRGFRTKSSAEVGNLAAMPFTGFLWAAGFMAILGLPPFGIFVSKLVIIKAMFASGHGRAGALFIFMLAVVFAGVAHSVMGMFAPSGAKPPQGRERLVFILPAALLGLCALATGLYIPQWLDAAVKSASAALGGAW